MIAEYTITACLSNIVLALTPSDRWAAARDLKSSATLPSWLIWSTIIALTLLAASFLAAAYKQKSNRGALVNNRSIKQGKPTQKQ